MKVRVLNAGMLTTVQDLGRFGYAHLGIAPAGAADALSFRIANLLVGNHPNEPALEMTLVGASLEFESRVVVSITGGQVLRKGGGTLPMWRAVELAAGAVLECGPIIHGARAYLTVQGGINVPARMGSASTHLTAAFGGFEGRELRNGDVLSCGASPHGGARAIEPVFLDRMGETGPIRCTRGVQWNWFADDAVERFLAAQYTVSEQSNRTGLRLSGAAVARREAGELFTEGVSLGTVQIPPDGQPIILLVDQQTTGGYPKIANVIAADLHRVGQLRPRDFVRFEQVGIKHAIQLLTEQEKGLQEAFAI